MFVNVEEIVMKEIKFLFVFSIVVLIVSCNGNISSEVYGNWAVLEVYYGETDISGIDRTSNVILSNSMTIKQSEGMIFLPSDSGKSDFGRIEPFRKDDKDWIKIYNATDERFNGNYLIHLKEEKSFNNGKSKRYSIVLESKNIYIYGEKTVVSF